MIKKLSEYEITSRDGPFINVECNTKIINTLVQKINELVDTVNTLQKDYETRIHKVYKVYADGMVKKTYWIYTQTCRYCGKIKTKTVGLKD